jgi:hypothetical protein
MAMLFAAVHESVKALCSEGSDHTFDSCRSRQKNQLLGERVLIWVKENLSKYEPMMAETLWGSRQLVRFAGLVQTAMTT